MNRTALRLATVAALLNGGNEPYPTLANDDVYDSRADAIDDLAADARRPCIIVRTDDDRTAGGSRLRTGRRAVELNIQIGVVTASTEGGVTLVGWPETDAELEAFIDLLEYQVNAALFGNTPWAQWWGSRYTPTSYSSVPQMTSPEEGRVRLAVRDITIGFDTFPGDCLPTGVIEADLPDELMTLPASLLTVFTKIAADGDGDIKTAAAALKSSLESQTLPAVTGYPLLETVRVTIPEQNPEEDEEPNIDIDFVALGDLPEEP